jgi:Fur family transcriptional regulator, ferric uptake regulator
MTRKTKQRDAIVGALEDAGRPLSPQEIVDAAEPAAPGLSLATVYRTIKLLTEEGETVVVPVPGEPDRYEHRTNAEHHHHHFRCDDCGKVYDVPGCAGSINELLPDGFTLRDHEVFLYGSCETCAVT